ncbi:uncharacterized protein [Watersipora subatra]|uniref:uncharacterized protein n=1 Tax=Watersipora subatra TaxID=2589382 RepID=UPI00355C840E
MRLKSCLTAFRDFQHCLKHKPPLILFTVGLLILSFSFVGIYGFIRDNTLIRDYNFRTNWGEFLTSLTAISWSPDSQCVKKVSSLPEPPFRNLKNEVYISVNVDNPEFEIKPGVVYQSTIWKERILPKELLEKRKHNVTVSFSCITNNQSGCSVVATGSNTGQMALCLNISSDTEFLSPRLKLPDLCIPSSGEIVKIYACDKTPSSNFHTSYTNSSQHLEMYLDHADKEKVCRRLLTTSSVMFTIVAMIIIYSFIKRRNHASLEETSTLNLLPVDTEGRRSSIPMQE